MQSTVGSLVSGRYRLQSPLGTGATAAVWRAVDLDLGRVVAVKLLHRSGVAPELAARFEREATILGRLNHPNVVPVIATGSDDGHPYLVMELVDGTGLDAVLAEGPMDVEDALELTAAVAAGLAAAHRAGVVHRDIKPANILVGHDGVPRIVDFGIARVSDRTSTTRADAVLGTAAYLSPEQARGATPEPATDVYALGCVLYQALTGHAPFRAESAVAVAYQHVHDLPEPPRTLRIEVSAGLESVVLRCLAKSPADRYPSAAELEAALRAVARGDAPAADEQATSVTPAVRATDTLVLPAIAPDEVIDRSPLVPAPPPRRGWRLVAAATVGIVALALALSSLTDDDPGTPVDAGTDETVTTTTSTTLLSTTVAPADEDGAEDENENENENEGEGNRGKGGGKRGKD